MSLTINTRVYTADRVTPDAVAYTGVANTLSVIDKFEMKRVYPKPQGTFKGVAKPTAKFTKTVVVNSTTGETAPLILEISGSAPVGVASADIDTILADGASCLGLAEAKSLFKSLDINA